MPRSLFSYWLLEAPIESELFTGFGAGSLLNWPDLIHDCGICVGPLGYALALSWMCRNFGACVGVKLGVRLGLWH